ncbi:T9SS type A sorting domain-containing protein [Flavobacterium cellulosilyticum]|uniref:T9SS type A sorting domain-containing protein n=1 Tax=Flavobacterium cellulosilyticum TaxID=2541731 RepID=A0A4R5C774_9FLAO|nr:T9SS type A sorting domain-containing protein [Flavobacterium cellulosilyticum]TDD94945.1 T9SS type A sorting domain-containing protein [Flavobacterium cellulosilyticum]
MKKIIFVLAFIASSIFAYSQNVIRGEYFIDAETGFGNGIPFAIAVPDTDITQTLNIPYSNFSTPGYHYVFIRILDANGNWSITKRKLVEADEKISALNLINIEYFFGVDNGFGINNAMQLVPSSDSTWTFNIPFNQIPSTWTTNDKLFLRVQDSTGGKWSITTRVDTSNLSTVGIDELTKLSGVTVYPNPFFDELNLILKNVDVANVKLYTIEGKLLFDKTINQTASIDTKFLSSGLYVLRVISKDKKIFSIKIVKK